jgi:hypothetical protein
MGVRKGLLGLVAAWTLIVCAHDAAGQSRSAVLAVSVVVVRPAPVLRTTSDILAPPLPASDIQAPPATPGQSATGTLQRIQLVTINF